MNKPVLYILCGFPFSGKTSLAMKMSVQLGCKIVAFDWIWAEMYPNEPSDLDKVEGWKQIRHIAKGRIGQLLQSGKSVVYDEVNPRLDHREEFRKLGKERGAVTKTIFIDIPVDEIRRRKAVNLQTKARHDVATHNFVQAINDFEEPTSGEEFLTISLRDNIDEWIQKLKLDR